MIFCQHKLKPRARASEPECLQRAATQKVLLQMQQVTLSFRQLACARSHGNGIEKRRGNAQHCGASSVDIFTDILAGLSLHDQNKRGCLLPANFVVFNVSTRKLLHIATCISKGVGRPVWEGWMISDPNECPSFQVETSKKKKLPEEDELSFF